ncbi:MAG: glycine zipper 2TM domain-containing protein [Candidatus Thiodiazotropha sp. (ex Epidulcina cf. delphinae)]|nr:glycine zipper 2TM domain-containing protein [Candidatus Thiodiazotropha sp. (ex Epidulcina cf. delphinae)]
MKFLIKTSYQTQHNKSSSGKNNFITLHVIYLFCIAISLAFVLSSLQGCVSTNDRQQTEAEGAVVGAAIGGLLGLALGDSKEAAIIGTVIGAVAGNMYGRHIADKKADYKDTESYMKAMIAESDKVLTAARIQHDTLAKSIERQKHELARLSSIKRQERGGKKKLERQIAKNKKDQKVTEKLIAAIDHEIQTQRRVVNKERNEVAIVYVNRSEANISAMELEKRQLELLKVQLAGLDYRRVY